MDIKTKPVLRGRFTEDNTIKVTFHNQEYSIDAKELGDLELLETIFVDQVEKPGELVLIFRGTLQQPIKDQPIKLKLVG